MNRKDGVLKRDRENEKGIKQPESKAFWLFYMLQFHFQFSIINTVDMYPRRSIGSCMIEGKE